MAEPNVTGLEDIRHLSSCFAPGSKNCPSPQLQRSQLVRSSQATACSEQLSSADEIFATQTPEANNENGARRTFQLPRGARKEFSAVPCRVYPARD